MSHPTSHDPADLVVADWKRGAAALLHVVAGPDVDDDGVGAILAEADEADGGAGRTAQLLVAVARLARGLCPDLERPGSVAALRRVALTGARLESQGLTGLGEDGAA